MKSFIVALLFLSVSVMQAQDFMGPADSFSDKKVSYFTMKDGSTIEANVKSIKRKKGLIEKIEVKPVNDKKKKMTLLPADIKHMYLMPSGFDKIGKLSANAFDAQEYGKDRSVDDAKITEGYVLFETTEVFLKKKKTTMLMQLLNPAFAKNIRVYYDPLANETGSVGVGGITVAGGDAKSYYYKKGNEPAVIIKKKDYDEQFDNIFSKCAEVKKAFKKISWTDFNKHIIEYNKSCN